MKKLVLCLLVVLSFNGLIFAGQVKTIYACGHIITGETRNPRQSDATRRSDEKCPSCRKKDEEQRAEKIRQQAEARKRQQVEARQQAIAKAASAGRNAARNDQSNGTGYNPNAIVNTFSSSEEKDSCYQAYNEEFNTIEKVKRGAF